MPILPHRTAGDHRVATALRQALDALESAQGNINPERGFAGEVEAEIGAALTAGLAGEVQQALDALESAQGNINPERGFADEVEAEIEAALAAVRSAIATTPQVAPQIVDDEPTSPGM